MAPHQTTRLKSFGINLDVRVLVAPFLVFFLTLLVYLSNLPRDYSKDLRSGTVRNLMPTQDVVSNTYIPYLILRFRSIDFSHLANSYMLSCQKGCPYYLISTKSGIFSSYPVLSGLMGIPIYLIPILLKKIPEMTYHESFVKIFALGRITTSFYSALSVTIYYLILSKLSKDKIYIYLFTFFYAFGTCTWSVSSRGMWQHTFGQFFISLSILLTFHEIEKNKNTSLPFLFSCLAAAARPTNILFAIVMGIYLITKKRNILNMIPGILVSVTILLTTNYVMYGSPFTEGYASRGQSPLDTTFWSTSLLESIPGYLFSPARSFLFISPPLLLFIPFVFKLFSKKNEITYRSFYIYLFISFILIFLVFCKWFCWNGANAFGYRMLVDVLVIPSVFAFLSFKELKAIYKFLVCLLVIYSVYVNANAVFNKKNRCPHIDNWNFSCLRR